jgi:hypothetical protein
MTLVRETKLNPIPIQTGYGPPIHISPAGSLYFDFVGKTEYVNKDGIVEWVAFIDSASFISASTITNIITSTAATLNILANTTYYGVNVNANVDLTLPDATSYDGYVIIVKDEGGNAKKHRIRITPSSGTIEGTNYVDVNLNYIALQIIARNNNWWII